MISRTKSIFSLGEEDEKQHEEVLTPGVGRVPKRPEPMAADHVGLRIVIQRSKQEQRVVVAKSAVRSREPVAQPRHSPAEPGFLGACCLCKKKLNPQKDIYMYRGDRAFCSVECRCKEILLDERRERSGAAARGRLAAPPHLHCAGGHRTPSSDRRGRVPAPT